MAVEIEVPLEFQANVLSTINKRRGTINNATIEGSMVKIECEVPLANMFGYATDLRSSSEGKVRIDFSPFLPPSHCTGRIYDGVSRTSHSASGSYE